MAAFRKQSLSAYRLYNKCQNLSLEEIQATNWSKRLGLFKFASENSLFYKEKYSAVGLNPKNVRYLKDWEKIPILKREEIRQNVDRLLTCSPKEKYLGKSTTGGTTGAPLTVYTDKRIPREALAWRMLNWWGIHPWDNGAYLWRMRHRPGLHSFLNHLAWFPTQKFRFDCTFIDQMGTEAFIKSFNRLKPPLLQGYTGAIAQLAIYLLEHPQQIHSPKAIWVTSSPLGKLQRQQIELAFQAPVYDQYGSCEVPHMAAQCAAKGPLHIHYDAVHLEFVDDNNKPVPCGEMGRILVTDLENFSFPLIRYENGDTGRALPGKCDCGINLPIMDAVAGRQSDILILPDGSTINGEYLTTIFDDFPEAIRQFQVKQDIDYNIMINYIPNPTFAEFDSVIKRIEKDFIAKVKSKVGVTFRPVDKIENDRGKTRFIISEAASKHK